MGVGSDPASCVQSVQQIPSYSCFTCFTRALRDALDDSLSTRVSMSQQACR